jgi:hypothetical protein
MLPDQFTFGIMNIMALSFACWAIGARIREGSGHFLREMDEDSGNSPGINPAARGIARGLTQQPGE